MSPADAAVPRNSEERLDVLSDRLVVNHLHLSSTHKGADQILASDHDVPTPHRTIAVVGAGANASYDIGLPLGAAAAQILQSRMEINENELQSELDWLESVFRLNKTEFETILLAMGSSVYRAEKLRTELQTIYRHRHPPLLIYEILAHMLKHRFLDAIINFNFDELLDQCLEDELGPGNYIYVLSDGDCLRALKNVNAQYDLPLYIKPHGTAGHRSTLRFTREAYYGLPADINQLLIDLFADKPVSLISVGFGMQSFEFNQVVKDSKHPVHVYQVNIEDPAEIAEDLDLGDHVEWRFVQVDDDDSLESRIESIWSRIESRFSAFFEPRSIIRHRLICELFDGHGLDVDEKQAVHYYHDRALVELCLAIAKTKGVVDLTVLAHDRSGRYFDRYRQLEQTSATLFGLCEDLGLLEVGYSREIMRLRKPKGDDDTGVYAIIDREELREDISRLMSNLKATVRNDLVGRRIDEHATMFTDVLLRLYDGTEIEINNNPDHTESMLYDNCRPLTTYTALKYRTMELIQDVQDKDILLVVAETGEWLLHEQVKKLFEAKNLSIYMILADLSRMDALQEHYGERISDFRQIPWWTHNRHMTILCRGRRPIRSIYFRRPLRSHTISPVVLERDGSEAIFESFMAYWKKSEWLGERPGLRREDLEDLAALFDDLASKKGEARG